MTTSQAIERIVNEWGSGILKDSIIFQTLLCNLIAENVQEIDLFQRLDDTAMNYIYLLYVENIDHPKETLDKLSLYLENEIRLSKQEIHIILQEFSSAFNCHINIEVELRTQDYEAEDVCMAEDGKTFCENVGELIKSLIKDKFPEICVVVEESMNQSTSFEVLNSMKINRGFLRFGLFQCEAESEEILKNPYILITNKSITYIQDIMPILHEVDSVGGELLIIASDIEESVISSIKAKSDVFKCIAISAPSFGDRRIETLRDVAILTGGSAIIGSEGQELCNVSLEMLGRAEQVRVKSDDTIIIGGKEEKYSLEDRLRHIKRKIRSAVSDFDREKLQERLDNLSCEAVVIKAGNNIVTEVQELTDNIEKAIDIYGLEHMW